MKPRFELIGINVEGLSPVAQEFAILTLNCVCGEGTAEEAEEWIRVNHPAGTTGNWHLATEDHQKPVPCDVDPKRTHYMFVC